MPDKKKKPLSPEKIAACNALGRVKAEIRNNPKQYADKGIGAMGEMGGGQPFQWRVVVFVSDPAVFDSSLEAGYIRLVADPVEVVFLEFSELKARPAFAGFQPFIGAKDGP